MLICDKCGSKDSVTTYVLKLVAEEEEQEPSCCYWVRRLLDLCYKCKDKLKKELDLLGDRYWEFLNAKASVPEGEETPDRFYKEDKTQESLKKVSEGLQGLYGDGGQQ